MPNGRESDRRGWEERMLNAQQKGTQFVRFLLKREDILLRKIFSHSLIDLKISCCEKMRKSFDFVELDPTWHYCLGLRLRWEWEHIDGKELYLCWWIEKFWGAELRYRMRFNAVWFTICFALWLNFHPHPRKLWNRARREKVHISCDIPSRWKSNLMKKYSQILTFPRVHINLFSVRRYSLIESSKKKRKCFKS